MLLLKKTTDEIMFGFIVKSHVILFKRKQCKLCCGRHLRVFRSEANYTILLKLEWRIFVLEIFLLLSGVSINVYFCFKKIETFYL